MRRSFFDDPAFFKNKALPRYWDGAVAGFNNPVMAGIVETLANNAVSINQIRVLSIGTGNSFLPVKSKSDEFTGIYELFKHPKDSNVISDIKLLARAIINDPPDTASFTAHVVLGGQVNTATDDPIVNGPLVRMNPLIKPKLSQNKWTVPIGLTPEEFKALTDLEMDAIEDKDVNYIKKLAKGWLSNNIDNQGIRMNGKTLANEIGHETYLSALTHWQNFDANCLRNSDWQNNHTQVLSKLS